jgi:hypothetical protein
MCDSQNHAFLAEPRGQLPVLLTQGGTLHTRGGVSRLYQDGPQEAIALVWVFRSVSLLPFSVRSTFTTSAVSSPAGMDAYLGRTSRRRTDTPIDVFSARVDPAEVAFRGGGQHPRSRHRLDGADQRAITPDSDRHVAGPVTSCNRRSRYRRSAALVTSAKACRYAAAASARRPRRRNRSARAAGSR